MEEPRKISFIAAVLMNINIIVGSGIYFAPQLMAQQTGGISFLGWVLAGLLLLPIVLTIAQAALIFPGEGGFYNYCKTALGSNAGFVANWAYLLGYMGTVATITSVVRDKLIADPIGLTFIHDYPIVFYILFMLAISLLNMLSLQLISKIQSSITLLKLLPLITMIGIIYFYWNPNFDYQLYKAIDLGGAVPLALFAFLGFESCCNISHYIRGGTAMAFKVILLAFSVSTFLYTIFHLGMLHIMGTEALAAYGVHAFPLYLGYSESVVKIFSLVLLGDMMLSFINTAYGASLGNIANMNILAKDGLIFKSKFLAKLNKNGMPAHAALVHGVVIIALVLFIPSTIILSAVTILGICVTFFLTLLAVFVQSWRQKAFGSLIMATLAFLSLGVLLYFTWTTKLGDTTLDRLLYASPLLIGIPAGFLMYKWVTKKNV